MIRAFTTALGVVALLLLGGAAGARPPVRGALPRTVPLSCRHATAALEGQDGRAVGPVKAEYRLFRSGGRSLQWMLVSSQGPPDGKVVVLSCAGEPLAQAPLGYAERVTAGPALDGEPTLEVVHTAGSGPNLREQAVALLQFHGGAVVTLWRHATIDASSAPLVPKDEATVFRWRFLEGGSKILVTGARTVGRLTDMERGRAVGRRLSLPAETFCFRSKQDRFVPCPS